MQAADTLYFVYLLGLEVMRCGIAHVEQHSAGLDSSDQFALEVLKNQWRTEAEVLQASVDVLLFVDLHSALSEHQSALNALECGEVGKAWSLFEHARQLAVAASHTVQGFPLKSLCARLRLLCIICGSFDVTTCTPCGKSNPYAPLVMGQGATSSTLQFVRKECVTCVQALASDSNVRARLHEELSDWVLAQAQARARAGGGQSARKSVGSVFSSLRKSILGVAVGSPTASKGLSGSAIADGLGVVASEFAVVSELSELNALLYRRLGVRAPMSVTPPGAQIPVRVELFHCRLCGESAMQFLCGGVGGVGSPTKAKAKAKAKAKSKTDAKIEFRGLKLAVLPGCDNGTGVVGSSGRGAPALLFGVTSQRHLVVYRLGDTPDAGAGGGIEAGAGGDSPVFTSGVMDSVVSYLEVIIKPLAAAGTGPCCTVLALCGCVNGSVSMVSGSVGCSGSGRGSGLQFTLHATVQAHSMNKSLRALQVYEVPHTGEHVILTAASDNLLKVWQLSVDPASDNGSDSITLVPAAATLCARLPCMAGGAGSSSIDLGETLALTKAVVVTGVGSAGLDLLCAAGGSERCDVALFALCGTKTPVKPDKPSKPNKQGRVPLTLPARTPKTGSGATPQYLLVGDGEAITCLQALTVPSGGRQLLCCCSYSCTVRVHDLHLAVSHPRSNQQSTCLFSLRGHDGAIYSCTAIQCFLFSGDEDGLVYVWNVADFVEKHCTVSTSTSTSTSTDGQLTIELEPSDTIVSHAPVTAMTTNNNNILFIGTDSIGAYFV